MEGETLAVAYIGGGTHLAVRVWRKRRRVAGNESVAPQDAAQEVQIRFAVDSLYADGYSGVGLVLPDSLIFVTITFEKKSLSS